MNCAHCMRGDAQNVDMSNDCIDILLSQTSRIENLLFTGGEPALVIEKMQYFLDVCKKNNIYIQHLKIVSNGKFDYKPFTQLIKNYREWIALYPYPRYYRGNIAISFSADKYHENDYAMKAYDYYVKEFDEYDDIDVLIYKVFVVRNIGRAKTLTDTKYKYKVLEPVRIETVTKDNYGYCPYRRTKSIQMSQSTLKDDEYIILCFAVLSADGKLLFNYVLGDYDEMDKYESGNIYQDSIEKIIENHNRKYKYCCAMNEIVKSKRYNALADTLDIEIGLLKSDDGYIQECNQIQKEYNSVTIQKANEVIDSSLNETDESNEDVLNDYLSAFPDAKYIFDVKNEYPFLDEENQRELSEIIKNGNSDEEVLIELYKKINQAERELYSQKIMDAGKQILTERT